MNHKWLIEQRTNLLKILKSGLESVNGRRCVMDILQNQLQPADQVRILAIGKAAESMCLGAIEVLGDKVKDGLLITRKDHIQQLDDPRIEILESDHPIPGDHSLMAGQALIEFLEGSSEDLLILMSGGASALVEVLPQGSSLDQLRMLNSWLLSNPWSIGQINQIRKSVSLVKGGRALQYVHADKVVQLTISDVQGNDFGVIGSGLFYPDAYPVTNNISDVPHWLVQMQQNARQYTYEKNTRSRLSHIIVADNTRARQAICKHATELKHRIICNEELYGEVRQMSQIIVQRLAQGEAGLYVWGGEGVVDLPTNPGRGGRCQALALFVAIAIKDWQKPVVFLACGTDGSDGSALMSSDDDKDHVSYVAGAVIDNFTVQRGVSLGLNVDAELAAANSGYYLEQTGELIDTGPTGTNVMDIMIAIKGETP